MNVAQFVLTCIFAIAFGTWFVYVCRNSYQIILPGLQLAYIIWVVHFYILTFEVISLFLRPIWRSQPHDFIFEEPIVCKIWGKVLLFLVSLQHFLITAFSGEKVQLYLKFYSCSSLSKVFKVVIWLGLIPNLGICIFYPSGPSIKDGEKRCGEIDTITQLCLSLSYFHWIVMNCIMVFIFRCSKQFTSESFQNLQHQIRINKKILPLIFLSSTIFFSVFIVHQIFSRNEWILFTFTMMHFVDSLLNNMLMHYTIFGHVEFFKQEADIRRRHELMMDGRARDLQDPESASSDVSGSCSVIGYYWVELPSSYPVAMSYRHVKDMNLWDYVISERRMLHQIEMCETNGAIPSISRTFACGDSDSDSYDFRPTMVNGQAIE